MAKLGEYFGENKSDWQEAKLRAEAENQWFTGRYIDLAVRSICDMFLDPQLLEDWVGRFASFRQNHQPKRSVGVVMAGNIPLVGFHDFLSVFISGCKLRVKLSSKDTVLWKSIFSRLTEWSPQFEDYVQVEERIAGCDAYIATGSNNTARYFSHYFGKYPSIIRHNRTSVAMLTGNETEEELDLLADDICMYYGLGCRNVSKIYTPENYDFKPLISSLNRYAWHIDHHKYKNNYDYQLALYLLNKIEYMSSDSVLLVPSTSDFAPISVLHYQTYQNVPDVLSGLDLENQIQCVVAAPELSPDSNLTHFGETQSPSLDDFADNADTLSFLNGLILEN